MKHKWKATLINRYINKKIYLFFFFQLEYSTLDSIDARPNEWRTIHEFPGLQDCFPKIFFRLDFATWSNRSINEILHFLKKKRVCGIRSGLFLAHGSTRSTSWPPNQWDTDGERWKSFENPELILLWNWWRRSKIDPSRCQRSRDR